ncbi:MAG: PEP-CTERM sorting domain-containing protein [Pontiella sp.]|nr:PEP-CTERM sorting domain-containing protein [Pontiella sp.]
MKKLLIAVLAAIIPMMASAELFGFSAIPSNAPLNPSIGENQLFMDVTETGLGEVSIVFTNTGPEPSTIAEIYFDAPDVEPPLNLALVQIINTPGVSYVYDANPQNLPAGRMFLFCADLGTEPENPAPKNGIDPYEYLVLEMTYTDPPHNFIDLLQSGDLRIGLHVISMGTSEDSESFINVIPEPSTALLLGFSGLLIKVRRDYRKKFFL